MHLAVIYSVEERKLYMKGNTNTAHRMAYSRVIFSVTVMTMLGIFLGKINETIKKMASESVKGENPQLPQ